MEWIIENWFWIMFFVIFIGMHLFGHGCHGGHGGKEGDEHKGHSDESSSEKKGGSSCH